MEHELAAGAVGGEADAGAAVGEGELDPELRAGVAGGGGIDGVVPPPAAQATRTRPAPARRDPCGGSDIGRGRDAAWPGQTNERCDLEIP